MTRRQHGELFALTREERIGANHESTGPQLDQARKSRIDVPIGAGIENMKLHPEGLRGRKKIFHLVSGKIATGWVHHKTYDARSGKRLRLAIRPNRTGSVADSKTIGIVAVAAFAASAAGVVAAAITTT